LRLIIFSFPYILNIIIGLIFFIAFLSIYISSFSAIAQIDIKKIIAYSSIAHMNFSLIGLFCINLVSILGSFFMMFGHALVSSALFFSIGILYDRFKTRIIYYYGGLVIVMPIWVVLFFLFILGNFGFPGTINFVGEFIIFLGSFLFNNFIIVCISYGLFLTLIYSLFLFNRLVFGNLKIEFIRFFSDFTRREFYIVFILFLFIIYFGLFPNLLFDYSFNTIFFYFF
jgi:NADH:ubiquinone oxidoreductase subunit 4 (subunit M)